MRLSKSQAKRLLNGQYAGSEDDLQIAAVKFMDAKHPGVFCYHVANERKTRRKKNKRGREYTPEGNRLKAMGVRPGVADLCVPGWIWYVEFKIPPNKSTADQVAFQEEMKRLGYRVDVLEDLDSFIQIADKISFYLQGTEARVALVPGSIKSKIEIPTE